MSRPPPSPPQPRTRHGRPRVERRAPRGRTGSLRWLQSLLGRPLALEQRDGKLHITLVDRRRPPELIRAQQRAALCEELRLRLAEHGERHVAVLRPLVAVHDALSGPGWEAVARLPSAMLARAHMQLLMLTGREPSNLLADLAERVRLLQAAAEAREDRNRRDGVSDDDTLVVVEDLSESVSADDWQQLERQWRVTESPALPAEPAPAPEREGR
jgi:hypothetical protein